jgi:SAM-dependent methyltransferase
MPALKPLFPQDAFSGTSDYYQKYRLPYPRRMLEDLLARSACSGRGRLLDLACGPGRVTIPIAPQFAEVIAVDLEPEMIEAARRRGLATSAHHIRWHVGYAEELDIPDSSIELITIGEAFHRLDQRRILELALRWLSPGGSIATLGCFSVLSGREPWQRIVKETVCMWTGTRPESLGAGPTTGQGYGPEHQARVFREAGLADVENVSFTEPHAWALNEILGFLYSTSVCSKALLKEKAEGFERDLRAKLLAHDSSGIYREETEWGFTLGRRGRTAS